ncbi:MAG TPA: GIY-YIG nuclease family protein [Candidatus Saccharimonadales bacterium]|nr:GIY-YIG nuclease family protein [Candidatus Saccharimonadales bacterium]
MNYYTYILQCADGTFYIGYTIDLKQRLAQHNGMLKGGAKYTRARKPVLLLYYEQFQTRQSAMKREYELKQLTHKQKENICSISLAAK